MTYEGVSEMAKAVKKLLVLEARLEGALRRVERHEARRGPPEVSSASLQDSIHTIRDARRLLASRLAAL